MNPLIKHNEQIKWNSEEKVKYNEAFKMFGKTFKKIANHIGSRTWR